MSNNGHDLPEWPAPIEVPVPGAADPRPVAEAIVGLWTRIDLALHPIVGRRGVAALHQRSMKLAAREHPWLAGGRSSHTGLMVEIDTEALHALLMQQTAVEAAAAGNVLFHEFRSLLASLIGGSLTHRLLSGVWGQPASGHPDQDPPP